MIKYEWKADGDMIHFYRQNDGKILGAAWKYANQNAIWSSKIYTEEFPFTNQSEKFLGKFIDSECAKKSVEKYWEIQDRTLIE